MRNRSQVFHLPLDGFYRRLAASEIDRGYVYLSSHRNLPSMMDTKDFTVELNGREFHNRKVNVSGRFSIHREFLKPIGTSKLLHFKLASRTRLVIRTMA